MQRCIFNQYIDFLWGLQSDSRVNWIASCTQEQGPVHSNTVGNWATEDAQESHLDDEV
jgi:hypothetical protein